MRRGSIVTLVALAFAGCIGSIGDVPGAGDNDTFDGTDPTDPRLDARVWRLTPDQFNTEVQRFFPGAPLANLPAGSSEHGLTNISESSRIDLGNISQFNEAIRSVAAYVVSEGASAARCETFGTSACVDELLDWLPEAAFRRPVADAEKAELRSVYDDVEGTYGAEWAFEALVRTVLMSPHFLYRPEIGPDGEGVVELDHYEIASLLSFTLTDSGPDEELLADARDGLLHDPDVREKHVRRLLPDTAPVWQRFFWEWLRMSTLDSQGNETGLDPALVADLHAEYDAFVANIVVEDGGNLAALLTTNHTWASPAVAEYYGVSHPGSGVERFDFDPTQRGGLLTLGSWLVAHGKDGRDNVVRRGMAVFRDAMCNDIKPLDIDLEEALRDLVGADATIREIADARSADPTCGACHRTSDPVGLAFESYGGDGRWQTEYPDGKPVEAVVEIDGETFENAPEVAAALAEDESFRQCLVRRFGHFVMGAEFGRPTVVRASTEAYEAFEAGEGSFEELLVAIVRDRAFIERKK